MRVIVFYSICVIRMDHAFIKYNELTPIPFFEEAGKKTIQIEAHHVKGCKRDSVIELLVAPQITSELPDHEVCLNDTVCIHLTEEIEGLEYIYNLEQLGLVQPCFSS